MKDLEQGPEAALQIPQALPCPRCSVPTYRLKSYDLNTIVFLYLFVAWKDYRVTACPPCMRREIGRNTLLNLVTANLLWPLVLVWNFCYYLGTFTRGHSRKFIEPARITDQEVSQQVVQLALFGATLGAFFCVLMGSLTGLLFGAIAYKITEATVGLGASDLGGEVGAIVAGFLVALVIANSKKLYLKAFGWGVVGVLAWLLVRWPGEQLFQLEVVGSALGWAIAGGLVAAFGGTWGLTLQMGKGEAPLDVGGRTDILLLVPALLGGIGRRILGRAWNAITSGVVGGALGGAAGGMVIVGIGTRTGVGVAVGAVGGLIAGAISGGAGGTVLCRELRELPQEPG